MNDIKWKNIINLNDFFENNTIINYDSESSSDEEESNNIDIVEYNNMNIDNLNSLKLLELQDIICNNCNKIIQKNENIYLLIPNLEFLKKSSLILSNKINQSIPKNDLKNNKVIRSSYKFCNFKHKCTYNYDNGKKACYADHYPHNMIYNDCDSLISFLNNNKDINNNKEINKSINTINFVIKHMYEELSNVCIYCKENEYDKYHKCKKNIH